MQGNQQVASPYQMALEQKRFMSKVYMWMTLGLVVTGMIAQWTASSGLIFSMLSGGPGILYALMIGEVLLVAWLASSIQKMSPAQATFLYFVYAVLNGITLSVIFIIYTQSSIASTFFITGGTFGVMSAYGYFTKKDLSGWGHYLFMGLIGLIIASVVNLFLKSSGLYWLVSYAGILIFVGLTAYDTQKIKDMSAQAAEGSEEYSKMSIIGALKLYLDFINLFILLLRFFGGRRD